MFKRSTEELIEFIEKSEYTDIIFDFDAPFDFDIISKVRLVLSLNISW